MRKLLLFACMLLVMASCKKDEEINSNPSEEKSEKAKDPVVESIIKFNKQVKDYQDNTASRSSETFTLEEAKDNIVNLFNAVYGEPMESYSQLVTDEFSVSIAVDDNGNVSINEAARVYLQMVEKARKGYKASNLSNKGYKYILVDDVNYTRGDSVTIDLKGRFGTKEDGSAPSTPGFHHDGPFEEGDDWHYVDGMGSCDGTRDGGADVVLRNTIRARYESEWPCEPENYRGLCVRILEKEFDGSDELYGDYLFYREDATETCISWNEMNDLLYSMYQVMYEIIPEDNDFILNVELDKQNLPENTIYIHNYYITNLDVTGNHNRQGTEYITHHVSIDYSEYIEVLDDVIGQQPLD